MPRARGSGVRTVSVRGRGRAGKHRAPSQKKKPMCSDGADCKYRHEHQHTQEFDHPAPGMRFNTPVASDSAARTTTATWGLGRQLGSNTGGFAASARGTSRGRRLGGESSRDSSTLKKPGPAARSHVPPRASVNGYPVLFTAEQTSTRPSPRVVLPTTTTNDARHARDVPNPVPVSQREEHAQLAMALALSRTTDDANRTAEAAQVELALQLSLAEGL